MAAIPQLREIAHTRDVQGIWLRLEVWDLAGRKKKKKKLHYQDSFYVPAGTTEQSRSAFFHSNFLIRALFPLSCLKVWSHTSDAEPHAGKNTVCMEHRPINKYKILAKWHN